MDITDTPYAQNMLTILGLTININWGEGTYVTSLVSMKIFTLKYSYELHNLV